MIKHNQNGAINSLAISLVLAVVLLVGAIGFGAWAYSQMTEYRDESDAKTQVAVDAAVEKESIRKDKAHAEADKDPLKTYSGPSAYGSVQVKFPKTWSGYVDDTSGGSSSVDGYFNPGVVPSTDSEKSVFALRVQVISSSYSSVLQTFSSQQKAGKLKVSAYSLPKLPKVVGVKVVGTLSDNTNVTMVVLPLRSGTVKIWTEGSQGLADYNKYILPNFTFSP